MMYTKGFVVSIHDAKGKVLRENRSQEVFLPFGSEYSLRIRNNNNRRACARISIDGTDILGEHQLVIDPKSFTDLDRFCIDGDISSGRRLKFVEAGSNSPHPDVQDPTSPMNGIIKVEFSLEKPKPAVRLQGFERCFSLDYKCSKSKSRPMNYSCDSINMMSLEEARAKRPELYEDYDEEAVGATVEGSMSRQAFQVINDIQLESHSETITLTIKPNKTAIKVKNTRKKFCSNCGNSNGRSANFCSSCGHGVN